MNGKIQIVLDDHTSYEFAEVTGSTFQEFIENAATALREAADQLYPQKKVRRSGMKRDSSSADGGVNP